MDNDIKKVIVYYIDITDEVEIMNFIKEDDSTTVEIELRDLKSILDDVVIAAYVTIPELLGFIAVYDNICGDETVWGCNQWLKM